MEMKAGSNEFFLEESGEVLAKIEFIPDGTDKFGKEIINVIHTNVYEGNNGKGLGKKLVQRVVEYARAENKSVKADCSYAKKVLESVEEYQDVIAK